MNSIDASEHYDLGITDLAPSLLTVIIDTNPYAWAALEDSLPLSKAVANILVFVNAHLACNYANEVAVVASHSQKAAWLYPVQHGGQASSDGDGDVAMNGTNGASTPQTNKYRPFRQVEEQVTRNLADLMASTDSEDLRGNTSTMLAGALTLALSHMNRRTIAWAEEHGGSKLEDAAAEAGAGGGGSGAQGRYSASNDDERLQCRLLIISWRRGLPAAGLRRYKGVYMSLAEPRGLLQYLMMAFLPDQRSRRRLVLPTRVDVDFRAACFCHRRVVDVGFVCSICLSIFVSLRRITHA
ncbi:hypothetical protein N7512_008533 [Penicillium capsulatum]|nr:hypothetical protein N7512_008533 [Penicillium capsulatum]